MTSPGKTRRRIAAEELVELIAVEAKIKKATAEPQGTVLAGDSRLMDIPEVGPVVAARILLDVGDVSRFIDRNRFASWTGTAPLDASSGEQNRHRLSRAGNRGVSDMIHIAAVTQLRPRPPPPDAYYQRKRADGEEAAGSNALPQAPDLRRDPSPACSPSPNTNSKMATRIREGTAGRLFNPARSTCPRTSTLRISHFPDPQTTTLRPPPGSGTVPAPDTPQSDRLTTEGSRECSTSPRVPDSSPESRTLIGHDALTEDRATSAGPGGPVR